MVDPQTDVLGVREKQKCFAKQNQEKKHEPPRKNSLILRFAKNQHMINWWFGLVVWDSRGTHK